MVETQRYRVMPLTPVHIGTGETAGPEEYFVDGQTLVRFHTSAVLTRWDASKRQEFERMIGEGRISDAIRHLREAARALTNSHWYRCALGRQAEEKLRTALDNPEQARGEIHPLPRNPYTGRVVIPGSAIKGALRTAVLSALVDRRTDLQTKANSAHRRMISLEHSKNHREAEMEAQALERELLAELFRGGDYEKIERDPFRFLKVTDGQVVPQGGKLTERVDLASVVYAAAPGSQQGPPMVVERLLSKADGTPATFEIEVAIDYDCMNDPRTRTRVGVPWPLQRDWLVKAANYHYLHRLQDELSRFPGYYSSFMSKVADDTSRGSCLLRIGRYSHFESLSAEKVRLGYNPQAKKWIKQGSTRTVCHLANDGQSVFGWVLLEPL